MWDTSQGNGMGGYGVGMEWVWVEGGRGSCGQVHTNPCQYIRHTHTCDTSLSTDIAPCLLMHLSGLQDNAIDAVQDAKRRDQALQGGR